MKNSVQLITYADRLGGSLSGSREVISRYFGAAVGGIHFLPFFRPFDGADAGFDPEDHTTVDPRLGSWADLAQISHTYDVMVDVIVNHMSSSSPQFQDFVKNGCTSQYADLFLTFRDVFPDGATEEALSTIYRPRPGLPFTTMRIGDSRRLMWTTFTPQQIDINVRSESGTAYLDSILDQLARAGVSTVRMDAVGYAVKTGGTSSFMTPETFDFIEDMTQRIHSRGMSALVEVHSHVESQVKIARTVDRVYDFALPPLVLYALYTGDAAPLLTWFDVRPTNAVTVLDTHDGIGVIDVGPDAATGKPGLLNPNQIDQLVEGIHHASTTSKLATGTAASNLDLYQVNCTFYDALGKDDDAYIIARAVQFFTPGIPQVYYVGALAGSNDVELLERTMVGRDINRHYYTEEEIARACQRPVVAALLNLMALRSTLPAFDGECDIHSEEEDLLMKWSATQSWAELRANFATRRWSLSWFDGNAVHTASSVAQLASFDLR